MNFRLAALLALLGVALAAPISHDEIAEKSSQGLRLLSLGENIEPVWKSEDEKLDLMRKGVQFVRTRLFPRTLLRRTHF